ncbi:SRPBCC family protein [Bradyrhizobium sp.]|uniref:SRPBCC family protein n=1 Tax=Bradyrhizobium sp. TaxID=376 RepID=UPI0023A064EB|nr:SRPBCC family protein [Bradyrhizobium sp.]MDE2379080.1 SRPBCC family protein [Bradyrhizobium sp.]
MATIHHDIPLDAPAADVWDAVRDFGAVHERLAPGFVTACAIDGDARVVTFANGVVAREMLVDCDETRRRLVYAISNERVTHYNASVQVIADGEAKCRLLWTIDLLPNAFGPYVEDRTKQAVLAMHKAFPPATIRTPV